MRARWIWIALAMGLATRAAAQEPAEPVEQDTAGAELLRVEIERRFAERVQADLDLTDDQMRKLKATQDRVGPRRRLLMRQVIGYRLALQGQMQPGIAANADSVRVYMDALQRLRGEQVALDQEEDRELASYLTPVQRARLHMMRARLIERVAELRRERQGRLAPRVRPGIRQGVRPRPRPAQPPRRRP